MGSCYFCVMTFPKQLLMKVAGWVCATCLLAAQVGTARASVEPEIVSIFPAGGRQGSQLEISIQGTGLGNVYGVWFDTGSLRGSVQGIEPVELLETSGAGPRKELKKLKKFPGHQVSLGIEVDPAAKVGIHSVRLVSSSGLSNALAFLVHAEPVVTETENFKGTAANAQPVKFPVVISGKIDDEGEVDFYSFEVAKNQELLFEAFTRTGQNPNPSAGRGFDAQLTLYESGESWFDSNRLHRLANSYHPPPLQTITAVHHRFSESGRYFLRIGAFLGVIGPGYSYQLLIAPAEGFSVLGDRGSASDWDERVFSRRLEQHHLLAIASRTVVTSEVRHPVPEEFGGDLTGSEEKTKVFASTAPFELPEVILATHEVEPNNLPSEAAQVTLPSTLEGVIGHPGDVDYFRFSVERDQRLSFEIETPNSYPPFFNPRLGVFGNGGQEELFTNTYKFIAGDGDDWINRLEPKTIYTFNREGEYVIEVRDMTSRHGHSSFKYRILIRDQIPHMGKVVLKEDRVNLKVDGAKRLTLTAEYEESYHGAVVFAVENLPVGVEAVAVFEAEPPPDAPSDLNRANLDDGFRERYLPESQMMTMLLVAGAGAQATDMPRLVRVVARPVVEDELGQAITVAEIPLMVVEEQQEDRGD